MSSRSTDPPLPAPARAAEPAELGGRTRRAARAAGASTCGTYIRDRRLRAHGDCRRRRRRGDGQMRVQRLQRSMTDTLPSRGLVALAQGGAARRRMRSGIEGPAGEIPPRRYSQGRIRRDLAWTESLEWCRDPFTRHRPRRDPARASRRPRGPPQPLYRGGCRRAHHRLTLSTERQSRPGTEIRLQARLVRAASDIWQDAHRLGYALHHGGRLQRNADRSGRVCTGALA